MWALSDIMIEKIINSNSVRNSQNLRTIKTESQNV